MGNNSLNIWGIITRYFCGLLVLFQVAVEMTPSSFRLVRNLSLFSEGFPTHSVCGNDNLINIWNY